MYGSSFWIVSLRPRVSSRLPIDAEASPLPSDETTPPVTKMNLVCLSDGRTMRAGAVIVRTSGVARVCLTPRRMSSSTRAAILSVASEKSIDDVCLAKSFSSSKTTRTSAGLVAQVLREAGFAPALVRDVSAARDWGSRREPARRPCSAI